jgi:predicted O-methyltransferase YrrM
MISTLFEQRLAEDSDIKGHLQFLRGVARGNVLELGVRSGNSTVAFLKGLEEKRGHLWSVDVIPSCEDVAKGHALWTFIAGYSTSEQAILDAGLELPLDVLFLDTLHTYSQVMQELEMWGPKVRDNGLILIHDVLTFPLTDMACHNYTHRNYFDYEVRPGYNGLGVIKKTGGQDVIKN